ncbi:MAG: hypothetical protein ACOX9R_18120 [Armatimonadota bacterium]|jgi:hypothetical protein
MRMSLTVGLIVCALILPLICIADTPPLAPVAELETDLPDRDGDGIPDDAELVIGMDPERVDTLHLIHENADAQEQAAELVDGRRRPVMERVYFGNVAQDRWVWRVDFTHDFSELGAQVMLYIDADYDASTGRPLGEGGADVRLVCRGASFEVVINNADVVGRDRRARGFVDGKRVYLSMDNAFNHTEQGNTLFRVRGLAQLRDVSGVSSSFGWLDVHGPGRQEIPMPPPGNLSQFLSENTLARDRWLGWREVLSDLNAVMLEAEDAQVRGMDRINRALEPRLSNSTARWSSPVAGEYHINALLQDSAAAREEVAVRVGGEELARFVAAYDDGDMHLFSTRRPVTLTRGAQIELAAPESAQDFRICEVFLTRALPAPGALRIMHLDTWCDPDQSGDRVDVDVVFVTDRPVRATVEWGMRPEALNRREEGDTTTYNHRITLTGLLRGATYSAQVLATEGTEEIRSETLTFTADRLRPERCGVERARVALQVSDMMDGRRPAWPVYGGIPIAEGQLSSAEHARLLDADGREVAAGFHELGWWGDGSVKWLLVSLLSEPDAGPAYTLEFGAQVQSPQVADGISVEESADGLRITTDVLQVALSRERFSPPGEVIVDLNRDGVFAEDELLVRDGGEGLVLIDDEGRRFSSAGAPATRLEVEEATPVRTVVVAEGPLTGESGKLMSYRVRMYFYRGFEGIPTVVSLIADEGDSGRPPNLTAFSSFTLPLSLGFEGQAAEAGRWVQEDVDRYATERDGAREEHDGAAAALATVSDGARSVSVGIRDFRELYPKGFSVEPGAIGVEMFPRLPEGSYVEHQDDVMMLTRNYYWFRDGAYQIPSGTAPSTELLLYFGDVGAEGAATVDEAWQSLALLTAGPEHYCASGAFGRVQPQESGFFDEFDRFANESLDDYESKVEAGRWYSWMNYGDWYGERGVNWGNHEYDLHWGLSLHFARTGQMRFLRQALLAARHSADIDIITTSARSDILGIHKEHALNHTGGYGLPRPEGVTAWFVDGLWNSGHMWTQGTYTAYALTGDRRFGDAAELVANWMAGPYARTLEQWLHRNYGWMTIGVLGSYNVRGNPYHLNAARLFTLNIASKADPGTGSPLHPIGECTHTPRHMGGKSFMGGVVMAALGMMDDIEPSERNRTALLGFADWLHAIMYHEETGTFAYAQCPNYTGQRGSAELRVTRGLARAYEYTGDERYREMVERVLAQRILEGSGSGHGKGFAGAIRQPPYALSALARMGVRELTPTPPREPQVRLAPDIYLADDAPVEFALNVMYSSLQPLQAAAEIVELPEGVSAEPAAVAWEIARGNTSSPAFRLAGQPPTGSTVTVRYTAGEWSGETTATFREPRAVEPGEGVGYVGGPDDPTGQALRVLGVELPALDDLSAETLSAYGGLIVGSEAHEKNYGGLRDAPSRLLDFIHAGGRVALVQIQDSSYQQSYLPHPLVLSNDSGSLGEIVVPEHPIFTSPGQIDSLAGMISYDTIIEANEAWNVLATDVSGRPSIVEGRFGEGAVIVIQPSPCRYAIGTVAAEGEMDGQKAARLFTNVLAWLAADD